MDQFTYNQDKNLFYFRIGHISKYSKSIICKRFITSIFLITLQLEFEKLFQNYFFSLNATIKAVNKLEGTIYYQESYTVEDYLDEFQILILEANYTNLYTTVIKFYYRLQTIIQNQIAILLVEKPEDIDPSIQFKAIYIEQIKLIRQLSEQLLFFSLITELIYHLFLSIDTIYSISISILTTISIYSVFFYKLDVICKFYLILVRECLIRLNIQQLTTKQQKEFIKDLNIFIYFLI